MSQDIDNAVMRQLMALSGLSVEELKDKWRDLYGSEPPEFKHSFYVKRLAYRIQELYYGGLNSEVKERIEKLSVRDDKKEKVTTTPGTRLCRIYKGKQHEVIVGTKCFIYKGQKYRSLSGVAKAITGSHWNGKAFFGIAPKR